MIDARAIRHIDATYNTFESYGSNMFRLNCYYNPMKMDEDGKTLFQ